MERVPQLVRRGKKDRRMGAPSELDWEAIEALRTEMRVELIQELIPLGLAEVGRVLDEEVERLAGPRHARKGEGEVIYRHGSNPGSPYAWAETASHPVRGPSGAKVLEGEDAFHVAVVRARGGTWAGFDSIASARMRSETTARTSRQSTPAFRMLLKHRRSQIVAPDGK